MAYRVIQQSLWTDEKVMDSYSCEDKYFWLYILTNPQTNQLGIYKLPVKLAAFQLGYSIEQVIVLLDRFDKVLHQIKYNRETQEIAIGNFLYHSVVKGGKPVLDCAIKDMQSIKDTTLIDFVIDTLSYKTITNTTVNTIIDLLKEKSNKKEIINDNDNDNDNDNGDTYHDTHNDTYHDTSTSKPKAKTTFSPTDYVRSQCFSAYMEEKVLNWLEYKKEKRDTYKETGLKALCTQIKNKIAEHDEIIVGNLIDECMANGWKGLIWDKVKSKGGTNGTDKRYSETPTLGDVY